MKTSTGGTPGIATRVRALSNAKQLGLATIMYAGDNQDHFPAADCWMDLVSPYVKNGQVFHMPDNQNETSFGFAFRATLSSVRNTHIREPDRVALIFNSKDRRWNAYGDLDLLPNPPEFSGRNVVIFADGHGKVVPFAGVVVR